MCEEYLCDRCGKKMDGPATGIGYWCPDLECGDEDLLAARELFKNKDKTYTQSEVDSLLEKQREEIIKEATECVDIFISFHDKNKFPYVNWKMMMESELRLQLNTKDAGGSDE